MTAFDVMDTVQVAVTVRCQQDVAEGVGEHVLYVADWLQGEGISDPREWLRDALICILEAL